MEERKYTFYDRYQKVKYANITVEELEVLNISYNKEHYMFDQQHRDFYAAGRACPAPTVEAASVGANMVRPPVHHFPF